MANFSTDEDLLKRESLIFTTIYPTHQVLAEGSNGVMQPSASVVIFSSSTGDLVNAAITSGHVLWLGKSSGTTVYYDQAYAVAKVSTSTTVHLEAKAANCPTCSSVAYRVCTYDPQHENVHFELMQHFGLDDNDLDTENDEADLYNVRQLREASATRVLELIYRGQMQTPEDYCAKQTEFYGMEAARTKMAVNLQMDPNDDSDPDSTRRRGSVDLIVDGRGDAWPVAPFVTKAEERA